MILRAVIGKNFGDEGKGLAVDHFAGKAVKNGRSCLVIRHNGGAQAGHTVETHSGRFIFHQLSAGSFAGADTLWSETYLPDLYKIDSELGEFSSLSGRKIRILADAGCRCTCIDDILLNMVIETTRGSSRHGSCGMGINECMQRSEYEPLFLGEVKGMTAASLYAKLKGIRNNYLPYRLKKLGLELDKAGEYGELLSDDNVLMNTAAQMCRNAELVDIYTPDMLQNYDELIFEGAQGLLLDSEYKPFAPHLTNSRTGSYNPSEFYKKNSFSDELELVYITRTYVTRHGNGPLPYAGELDPEIYHIKDKTNIPNDWQGTLRFAPHGSTKEFLSAMTYDTKNVKNIPHSLSLMITHINETRGEMCCHGGNRDIDEFTSVLMKQKIFSTIYRSASPFGEPMDIQQ